MNFILLLDCSSVTNHANLRWNVRKLPVDFTQDRQGADVDSGFGVVLDVFQDGFGDGVAVDAGERQKKGFGERKTQQGLKRLKVSA